MRRSKTVEIRTSRYFSDRLSIRLTLLAFVLGSVALICGEIQAQIASPLHNIEKTPLVVKTSDGATIEFLTVVVTNPEDQRKGLMHIRRLPVNESMTFLYVREGMRTMWMKNTKISLDMWFLNREGEIVHIEHRTKPESTTTISSTQPAIAVIEVNGGLSDLVGVTKGSSVRHVLLNNMPDRPKIKLTD